ncbi:hypothetical protein C9J21_20355 [Photobacterium phosphoreum]|nr:hypothetical protein C9J21_20355 [Photobacterium phosphoreum]
MEFYSFRDLPEKSRTAIRHGLAKGWNIEQTAAFGEITNKAVRKAVDRIVEAHRNIMLTYLHEDIGTAKVHHNKKQARLAARRKKARIKQDITQRHK